MPDIGRHDNPTNEPPPDRYRPDGQWLVGAVGIALALGVIVFRPALPYELDSAASIGLFLGGIGAAVWLAYKVWQWRQNPRYRLPRGFWAAGGTTTMLAALLVIVSTPQEEQGYRSAYCQFGIYGFGKGTVWAKVEPEQPHKLAPHTVTVRWGGWIGQPEPVALTETTYFTFLKRDFHSGPASVSVTPDSKITCGDGEPPPDRPRIHLDGDDWKQRTSPPKPISIPPNNCPPADDPSATRATVTHLENDPSLAVGSVYHTATLVDEIQFEAGGELRGEIPVGKQLFQLSWADPTTRDSTPDRNPGSGIYYRSDTFYVTSDGHCWLRPKKEIAYDGAGGLIFRVYLVLVDDEQVADFTSSKYENGYNDEALKSLGVTRLAYFEVPTTDLPEG